MKKEIKEAIIIEQRHFKTELRAKEDSRTVEGIAAVMDQSYDMGWYEERIVQGAFDNALTKSDIRCLVNHDSNQLLARSSSKTLEVWIEGNNLKYRFEAPNTQAGNDLLELLKRGDLKESSFQFSIKKQRWEEIQEGEDWRYIRHIEEFEMLYDVSPVTFPANPNTSVAKRSFDVYKEQRSQKATNKKSIPLSLYERELEAL